MGCGTKEDVRIVNAENGKTVEVHAFVWDWNAARVSEAVEVLHPEAVRLLGITEGETTLVVTAHQPSVPVDSLPSDVVHESWASFPVKVKATPGPITLELVED